MRQADVDATADGRPDHENDEPENKAAQGAARVREDIHGSPTDDGLVETRRMDGSPDYGLCPVLFGSGCDSLPLRAWYTL